MTQPTPQTPAAAAAWLARNAVDCLPEGGLEAKLGLGRPLRVKLGIDPTAPDIHLGFTVVLQKLREFQDLGHTVVLIIGDYTARVGDPSGRTTTRPVLDPAQIDANARTFTDQALKVLDSERLEIRFNGEWLDMRMDQLFGLLRTATVARILERDDFHKRYTAGEPISILELLYPLLQGYDSVAVRADVELGGTDQKFNLLLGRDIQRAYGQPEQVILTLPLLVGTDGVRKMSKSYDNYIGVAESPEQMYGKTLTGPRCFWARLRTPSWGRATSSGRWRAHWSSASTTRTRRQEPRRHLTVSTSAMSTRPRWPRWRCRVARTPAQGPARSRRPTGKPYICRPCWPRPSGFPPLRPGAVSPRERCAWTGNRCPPWTCRRRSCTAGCCSSASAALPG
jgi:hypothetical protein